MEKLINRKIRYLIYEDLDTTLSTGLFKEKEILLLWSQETTDARTN